MIVSAKAIQFILVSALVAFAGFTAGGLDESVAQQSEVEKLKAELEEERNQSIAILSRLLVREERPETAALLAAERLSVADHAGVENSLYAAFMQTRLRLVLAEHGAGVVSAVYSPNGTEILTASKDRTARLWDAKTGQRIVVFEGHASPLREAFFCGRGSRIITVPESSSEQTDTVRLWESPSGRAIKGFAGYDASCSPDGRWAAIFGEKATLIDSASGSDQGSFAYTNKSFTFSRDGTLLTALREPNVMQIVQLPSGQIVSELRLEREEFQFAQFSADGKHLLTGDLEGSVRLWDVASGKSLQAFAGEFAESMLLSHDQRHVVSGQGQQLQIWDAATGKTALTVPKVEISSEGWTELEEKGGKLLALPMVFAIPVIATPLLVSPSVRRVARLEGHAGIVTSTHFDSIGDKVVTSSEDGSVKIWDAQTAHMLFTLRGHQGPVNQARFSPDNQSILTASEDGTARVWGVEAKGHGTPIALDPAPLSIASNRDGSSLALAYSDGLVEFRDGEALTISKSVKTGCSAEFVFSLDLNWLFCWRSDNKHAEIWDLWNSKLLRTENEIAVPSWHPDAPLLVLPLQGEVKLLDVKAGTYSALFRDPGARFTKAVFNERGDEVAVATENGNIYVRSLTDQARVRVLSHKVESFRLEAYHSERKLLAGFAGDLTQDALVLDAANGEMIARLVADSKNARPILGFDSLTFFAGAERLLTSENGSTLKAWDIRSKGEVASISAPLRNAILTASAFAADSGRLYSLWRSQAGEQRQFLYRSQIFPSKAELIAEVHRQILLCLTSAERSQIRLPAATRDYCNAGTAHEQRK